MKRVHEVRWLYVLSVCGMVLTASGALAAAQEPTAEQKPADTYQAFYLTNSTGVQYANDVQTALRNLLPKTKIYYVLTSNALMLRGSAQDLAEAQKILADLDRPRKMYRLTYTLSEGGSREGGQHFVLLVSQGEKTTLKQGSRVPIMTGSYGTGSDQNTQVQYVDVGMNLVASLEGYGEGSRVRTKIEESSVAEEKSNVGIQDPVIRQSVLESDSTVVAGKPIVLGSVDLPGSGKHMEVSVVAEVVK